MPSLILLRNGYHHCHLLQMTSQIWGMDVSIMSRMKELEEENRRLKKMYLEEKLKAEIVSEALEKKW